MAPTDPARFLVFVEEDEGLIQALVDDEVVGRRSARRTICASGL